MRAPRRAAPDLLTARGGLTNRDRWILRMLLEHRVLTTPQITALAFGSDRVAQRRLRLLHTRTLTERFAPYTDDPGTLPDHHVLGPLGAAVLAAEESVTLDQLGYRRDEQLGLAHVPSLAHTVGVNTFFTDLAAAGRPLPAPTDPDAGEALPSWESDRWSEQRLGERPGRGSGLPRVVLEGWWSETRCARQFGHHVHPDGYGALLTPARHSGTGSVPGFPNADRWGFFLEYDRGTEDLGVLAGKLTRYHRLARAVGMPTPVLVVLTRPGREPGAREALADALARLPDPDLVPVATTAITDTRPPTGTAASKAARPDPAGHIWSHVTPERAPHVAAGMEPAAPRVPGGGRWSLAELSWFWRRQGMHPDIPASGRPGGPSRQRKLPNRGRRNQSLAWRPAPLPWAPPVHRSFGANDASHATASAHTTAADTTGSAGGAGTGAAS